jgi:hypothetical protein
MKLRCLTVVDKDGRRHDGYLTEGTTYVAYTLKFGTRGHDAEVRVRTDQGEGAVGLYSLAMFELIDGHISSRWSARAYEDGSIQFGPHAWLDRYFWDDDAVAVDETGYDPNVLGARTRWILEEMRELDREG